MDAEKTGTLWTKDWKNLPLPKISTSKKPTQPKQQKTKQKKKRKLDITKEIFSIEPKKLKL